MAAAKGVERLAEQAIDLVGSGHVGTDRPRLAAPSARISVVTASAARRERA